MSGFDDQEIERLQRKIAAGPARDWLETDDPDVMACMGSAPECAQKGCQARMLGGAVRMTPQGWQTMETAPKDGGMVLLYPSRCWCEESDRGEVGYWDEDMQEWCSSSDGAAEDWNGYTHWMPLPAPPSDRQER